MRRSKWMLLSLSVSVPALLAGCNLGDDGGGSGGSGGSGTGLACKDAPTSKACDDCVNKAKFEVCSDANEARIVACLGCDVREPFCDVDLCQAKTAAHDKCTTVAAKELCGYTADPGTGGTGGTGGSGAAGGSGGTGGAGATGGSGGSGGAGGTGGSGGTGGTGGSTGPCDGAICGEGEVCTVVDGEPVCGCTTNPDSCLPYGTTCQAGACVDRPERIREFGACDTPGDESPDGRFLCLIVADGGPSGWIRRCDDSSECVAVDTYCDTSAIDVFGSGVCTFNYCGSSALDPATEEPVNGTSWGVCDPGTQFPDNPLSSAPKGACMVGGDFEGLAWLCRAGGSRPIGSACSWNAARGSTQACVRGSFCLVERPQRLDCASDADCASTQVCKAGSCADRGCETDAHCGPEGFCDEASGFCMPYGTCTASCNAGAGPDTPPFGRCPGASDVCWGLIASGAQPHTTGYCGPVGCNLLGGPGECPSVDGRPGMCRYSGWAKGRGLMGRCGIRPSAVARAGENCDELECEEGSICVGLGGVDTCLRFCECPGAQWNDQGVCTTATTCSGGTSCGWFGNGAGETMGVCF